MYLLAIETATEACSIAVYAHGKIYQRFEIAPRRHAELVLPWATQILEDIGISKTQIDAIAVGRGPGAFTGVRLAISLAQGMAFALDRPVVPVSTLEALALRAPASARKIIAAIDARMSEVYTACYQRDGQGLLTLSEEQVLPYNHVSLPNELIDWAAVGTGFSAADNILVGQFKQQLNYVDSSALPEASDIAKLAVLAFANGKVFAPEDIQPAYLRNNVALTLQEQIQLREKKLQNK